MRRTTMTMLATALLLAYMAAEEITDPYRVFYLFSEPAVERAHNNYCSRIVAYKPFWAWYPIFAVTISQEDAWLPFYHVGNQLMMQDAVNKCKFIRDHRTQQRYDY